MGGPGKVMAKSEAKFSGSTTGQPAMREASAMAIGRAYQALAAEHVELRARSGSARAMLAENVWHRIQVMEESRARGASGLQKVGLRKEGARTVGVWLAVAACAAASLVGGAWAFGHLGDQSFASVHHSDGRVHFEVDGTSVGPDEAGRGHLIASESIPVGIRLSDKSQINLQPHTTLRLSALSDGVVITRISQGALDVEVMHQEHTDYQFFAGPFLVKVVGTAFRIAYDPDTQSMDLRMRSGVVEVLGPDGASRMVRGGEVVHLQAPSAANVVGQDASQVEDRALSGSTSLEAVAVELDAVPAGEAAPDVVAPGSSARARVNGAGVDFHGLAAQGSFAKIVEIANAHGVGTLLASAPSDQLQELAQAARYTGHLALAERVWLHMSSRFAGRVSGYNATFFLGRLDEQRGRHVSALGRYESYLRSSPKGVYAQEAWGRKLQLSQKTRGVSATVQVAQQYLERFPSGPYAATAKGILSRSAPR